jgi:phosphoserine phosphatase RsbU/P
MIRERIDAPSKDGVKTTLAGVKPPEREGLLKSCRHDIVRGETIGKIASGFLYVLLGETIDDLAGELLKDERIHAVGAVNDQGGVEGVILRDDVLGMLSKPFGRELFRNKLIDRAVKRVKVFDFTRSVYSVAEEIAGDLGGAETNHYALIDGRSRFAGVFTSDDLVLYLSEMMQRDLALAQKLQSCIVKEEIELKSARSVILGASKMARGVGGDYFSIRNYADGKFLLAICDVSGKGMPASLLSVLMDGMLGIYDLNRGIEGYIVSLNSYIFNTFRTEKFITGVFVDFDEMNGIATVYDMGHSYHYLLREERFINLKLKYRSLPIGIDPDCAPRGNSFTLQSGDCLLLFTDGIEEQKNTEGDEFGISGIVPVVKKLHPSGLKALKDGILDEIRDFKGTQTQQDDITMILLHYP